jgi:hypothetical protein
VYWGVISKLKLSLIGRFRIFAFAVAVVDVASEAF